MPAVCFLATTLLLNRKEVALFYNLDKKLAVRV